MENLSRRVVVASIAQEIRNGPPLTEESPKLHSATPTLSCRPRASPWRILPPAHLPPQQQITKRWWNTQARTNASPRASAPTTHSLSWRPRQGVQNFGVTKATCHWEHRRCRSLKTRTRAWGRQHIDPSLKFHTQREPTPKQRNSQHLPMPIQKSHLEGIIRRRGQLRLHRGLTQEVLAKIRRPQSVAQVPCHHC